jgi:hypothetical protein
MRQHDLQVDIFADYFQFYLWDPTQSPEAPTDYVDEDMERRIKTGRHVVVICPERNYTVPVEIELHDTEPAFDAEAWDHIAEASLHLPGGRLQVHECTGGPVADRSVEPGWYRVRSFHGGLGTVDNLEGNDTYRVVLWPAPPAEVRVLKQWPAPPQA